MATTPMSFNQWKGMSANETAASRCPPGMAEFEDGSCYDPANPPTASVFGMPYIPSQSDYVAGAVSMLPGVFGGGGSSVFVPQGTTPRVPQSTGTINDITPVPPPPMIGSRPGDVLDKDNSGTIDYLMLPRYR